MSEDVRRKRKGRKTRRRRRRCVCSFVFVCWWRQCSYNIHLPVVILWSQQFPVDVFHYWNVTWLVCCILQAEEVVHIISGQTVGQLAAAVRDYCSWARLNMSSSSSSLSSSTRPQSYHQPSSQRMLSSAWISQQKSCLPQSLFDFLIKRFTTQRDR